MGPFNKYVTLNNALYNNQPPMAHIVAINQFLPHSPRLPPPLRIAFSEKYRVVDLKADFRVYSQKQTIIGRGRNKLPAPAKAGRNS